MAHYGGSLVLRELRLMAWFALLKRFQMFLHADVQALLTNIGRGGLSTHVVGCTFI